MQTEQGNTFNYSNVLPISVWLSVRRTAGTNFVIGDAALVPTSIQRFSSRPTGRSPSASSSLTESMYIGRCPLNTTHGVRSLFTPARSAARKAYCSEPRLKKHRLDYILSDDGVSKGSSRVPTSAWTQQETSPPCRNCSEGGQVKPSELYQKALNKQNEEHHLRLAWVCEVKLQFVVNSPLMRRPSRI